MLLQGPLCKRNIPVND